MILNLCRIVLILFTPYVLTVTIAEADDHPNVLLLCIDDLRPELRCFGKPYIHSPNIDSLAARGRAFHRHYVQAPTCGASRFTLLTGRYGSSSNQALFERAALERQDPQQVTPSLPAWFRQYGYATVSVGKVSHHPGGRGGQDWDRDDLPELPNSWDRNLMPCGPWQHPRGAMHGLANGEMRIKAEDMALFQAAAEPDAAYPDDLIVDESLRQLEELTAGDAANRQPFFLAVGIIRPHLPFGAPAKYFAPYQDITLPPIPHPTRPSGKTTWHGSGEFMRYHRWQRDPNTDSQFATLVRKHYAACITYADAQVGRVIARLDALGVRDDTIIVLWGDHGWHLGEHAIWGKHALFEESLRSPLIVSYPNMPSAGKPTDSLVETLDIYPTLCDLAGMAQPDFVQGVSLRPLLESPNSPGHSAISYAQARTIRTATHRLIVHRDGYTELYDHRSAEQETRNIAELYPKLVEALTAELRTRLP